MTLGPENARLDLANGWTVSFGPDTPPAYCSVAAWPTNGTARSDRGDWFDFGDGRIDARCWLLSDVCDALKLIQAASPPNPTQEPQP